MARRVTSAYAAHDAQHQLRASTGCVSSAGSALSRRLCASLKATNAGSLSSTVWCVQAGINYGPPGNKQLIYFVDDLNMPKLDPYETAMPVSLIRQHLGWGHWFDRSKLTQKNINNTQ